MFGEVRDGDFEETLGEMHRKLDSITTSCDLQTTSANVLSMTCTWNFKFFDGCAGSVKVSEELETNDEGNLLFRITHVDDETGGSLVTCLDRINGIIPYPDETGSGKEEGGGSEL